MLDLYWATGAGDTGRYCLDVLNSWHTRGFDGERCTAFVQIDPRRLRHVELACWMFGGVYIGLLLPRSAQWQRDEGTLSSGADARPGSWGGHAVNLIDYTRGAGPVCVTWGRLRTARVLVVDGQGSTYWAGVGPRPAEIDEDWPA